MSSKFSIDINCDVGEGIGNESELMPFISSCNIACNEHAGSIEVIDKVISLAKNIALKLEHIHLFLIEKILVER